MTVSIRRLSLGAGFAYLMRSVARGDDARSASSELTRYYAESGTPAGRWLGSGLAGLGGGSGLSVGSAVTHEQLWRLLGMVADPVTEEVLGRRPRSFRPHPRARERGGSSAGSAGPVAGFDVTMSVPKSVSAVWAVADAQTLAVIYRAHRDAIEQTLAWAEQYVAYTRTGRNGVVQEPVRGLVAAAFDHWDSRAGDPHLHTHVVISNRVQGPDGAWRTLDARVLFRYTVALSELHEGVLSDLLTERLGYGWTERTRAHSAAVRFDLAGVSDDLIREFSSRSAQIEDIKNDLVAAYVAEHGRQPSLATVLKLRQQATLTNRPDKQQLPLDERMTQWRERAARHIGPDLDSWAARLRNGSDVPALSAGSVAPEMRDALAASVLDTVATKRATFGHANLLAETHRQLHGTRFATPSERLQVAGDVADRAAQAAVRLSPDPLQVGLDRALLRPDGTAKTVHVGADVLTSQATLDAENRLLDASHDLSAPTTAAADLPTDDFELSPDQAAAVAAIAESGRSLDLLVGPAGAGKITSLNALRQQWEATHGPRSVVGLAPTAAAAEALATGLHVPTDNTAKWLIEQAANLDRAAELPALRTRLAACSSTGTVLARRLQARIDDLETQIRHWTPSPGQLVIVDEAGATSTKSLDRLAASVRENGAKLLLVGDSAQFGAIEAGGAFRMLVDDREQHDRAPELTEVHRFHNDWERDASLQLRRGNAAALDAYATHGRLYLADSGDPLAGVLARWATDHDAGLDTVMIARDTDTVRDLNHHAHAALAARGDLTGPALQLHDRTHVQAGDRIITRHNDRTLHHGNGWVRNGDTWTVRTVHDDRSLTVTSPTAGEMTLPADYATQHVELGYAITITRAQGRTLDTAHALIDDTATRPELYVAATRGRHNNTITVISSNEHDVRSVDAAEPLAAVLDRWPADNSAHSHLSRQQPREHETTPWTSAWPGQDAGVANDLPTLSIDL